MTPPTLLKETRAGWILRRIICVACLGAALVLAVRGRWGEAGILALWGGAYGWVIWREYLWRRKFSLQADQTNATSGEPDYPT